MALSLPARYFQRLKLDPSRLDRSPTLKKLTSIVEAHVEHIPFENLSQHGAARPACLDVKSTAEKILDGYRGGFCYEVNSLLSEFLSVELGYRVHRLPAIVYSKEQGYNKSLDGGYFDSHICMIVTIDNDDYFVDVGHGEPPLHPLKFEFDTEQKTPEGMISRFVDNGKNVGLERWSEDSCRFEPSIQFKWQQEDASRDIDNKLEPLSAFCQDFELQFIPGSPFVQKIICCRITRTHKYTVAGHRLKITTPRFGAESQQTVSEIESSDEGRSILYEIFGMPLEETVGLDFQLSKSADPAIHGQF